MSTEGLKNMERARSIYVGILEIFKSQVTWVISESVKSCKHGDRKGPEISHSGRCNLMFLYVLCQL